MTKPKSKVIEAEVEIANEAPAVAEKSVKKVKAPAETKFISSAGNNGRVKRFSV